MEDKQTYITKIEGLLKAHGEDWYGDRRFFELRNRMG